MDSEGKIDSSLYDIVNVVDGKELVKAGNDTVVASRFKIQTQIQAYKAGALTYAETPGEGEYAVALTAKPRRSPSRTYDPIDQRPGQLLSGPFPHRNGAGGGHCGRRRMTMKQYFRRPQDVVGEDRDLLTYWNTMSGKVQLRLLESGLSVSTLGELKMLQEQIEHEG